MTVEAIRFQAEFKNLAVRKLVRAKPNPSQVTIALVLTVEQGRDLLALVGQNVAVTVLPEQPGLFESNKDGDDAQLELPGAGRRRRGTRSFEMRDPVESG
jgi:hypothetical protein